ncbi:protein phosphatase [Carbonactinospora thermoautotrophica]|uniref:PP2C family protein-serine/threonine phosphatase n=1 Tax=Carbonactinospora thermoautotrophica TaxID=1469144 RepID=UPI00226FEFF5|nr:protein phosphatase 2C domain-containing protein [Carbonactinospora thermoautotrophica]MCX9191948.1 protein phosphatase [Carbonactinospora thermoautotrophica]
MANDSTREAPSAPPAVVTVLTHRGAVREANEDALVIGPCTVAGVDMTDPVTLTVPLTSPLVVAVADGLGGHAAGEVAAALAVNRLAKAGAGLADREEITALLERINEELYEAVDGDPRLTAMGTTVAGLVLTPGEALWFNVGDSRVYREVAGRLSQLSEDDSPRHPDGRPLSPTSVVMQALGGSLALRAITPHVGADPVEHPTRWLLCSDGLTDLVSDADLAWILAAAPADDPAAVRSLFTAAMDASGRDNITIALVRYDPRHAHAAGRSPSRD